MNNNELQSWLIDELKLTEIEFNQVQDAIYFCNLKRLLWIGYYKNIENKQCYLGVLPKDVISLICFFL